MGWQRRRMRRNRTHFLGGKYANSICDWPGNIRRIFHHGEVYLVEIDLVVVHLTVPVLLIVDGDPIPACLAGIFVFIDGVFDSVQGNGFVEQTVVGRPLHLNDQVIPGVTLGPARNSSGNPLRVYVVVDVPLVATGNAAFVPPYESLAEFAPHELVDVEFQRLRG